MDYINRYNTTGAAVIPNVMPESLITALKTEIHRKISDFYAALTGDSHEKDWTIDRFVAEMEAYARNSSVSFAQQYRFGLAAFNIWTSESLLTIAHSILGPDVSGHPFKSLRVKPPYASTAGFDVPWHQDSSYLRDGAYTTPAFTTWIPLVDADSRNGGLEIAVLQQDFRKELAHRVHQSEEFRSWYTEISEDIDCWEKVCMPVKRGSVVVFDRLTPHRSLPNFSDGCRWSLDLRFFASGNSSGANPTNKEQKFLIEGKRKIIPSIKNEFLRNENQAWDPTFQFASPSWLDRWR